MAEKLTFIHAADVHLGAPFRGLRNLSPKWADRLTQAISEAYDRLVHVAIDRSVDFVVIAGDSFDEAHPSYDEYMHFIDGLKLLDQAGIPVYLVTGNHDPYTSWQHDFSELPANTHILSATQPDFMVYTRDGKPMALIAGRSYYNQTWSQTADIAEGLTREAACRACGENPPFAVGVLHTGLDLDQTKAPTKREKLLQTGMDYWALGHIHMPYLDSEADPHVVFSGCLQGRSINETGPRGVYQVTLEEGKANSLEFIPTASVVWQRLELDISQMATLAEVADAAVKELFRLNGDAHCAEMVERITLRGATQLHATLGRPGVLDDLRSRINDAFALFFCDALVDETRAPIDRQALAVEGLFPAVFMEAADSFAADAPEQVTYLQQCFMEAGLRLPLSVERNIGDISQRAQDRALDLLMGGE